MDSSLFLQYLFAGITYGIIYAIVAIGFNIIYNTTGIINFAQGEFLMLGGMISISLMHFMPLPLAIALAVIITMVVGALIEIIFIRWIENPSVLRMIIITIGISILVREAALHIWGESVRSLPYFIGSSITSVSILDTKISPQVLIVIGVCSVVVVFLSLFFKFTSIGREMRACAANRKAATLCGINVKNMVTFSFMLSAGIGALAGAVMSPITYSQYDNGTGLAIKGFTVAIMGGLGNSMGAVAAGLMLGIIEAFSISVLPLAFQDAVAIAILLIILFIRPHGLFGSSEAAGFERVLMDFLSRYLPIAGLLVIIISAQLLTSVTDTAYYLTQLTMAAYYSLLIIGLCVLMGYAGQISLGHAGFFAIGGYLSASLTSNDLSAYQGTAVMQFLDKAGLLVERQSLYGEALLNVQPWPACIIAVTVAIVIAFILGIPVLKLKGHYLAMATPGFGIIIFRIVLAAEFFGEADGVSEVPPFQLFPGISVNGDFADRVQNYYIAWGLLLLGLVLLLNLIHSRVGRALRSIHGSEEAAEAIGVNTARYKLYAFVISAAFAAVAGSFLTHYNGGIGPSEASVMKSVRYVAIVAVGGMGHLWGALIMGILLNFMSLRGMFGTYDDAVFGVILILIMLFAPQGILSLRIRNIFRLKKNDSGTTG